LSLVLAATVLWSTAGLFVRMLDLDMWTMQAWRALFGALSLLLLAAADNGTRTLQAMRGLGALGVAAIVLSAISMFTYVAALKLTTVANVVIVYATVPFLAAGIAFLWVGESIKRRTVIAGGMALLGIAVMGGGATGPGDIAGGLLSFVMTLTFAVLLVMARQHPGLPMAPINGLAALLCAVASWPFAASGVPAPAELLVLALFGITTSGLAYLLFLTGGRHIPSGEAGLVGLLEVVLGPLWVWLAFREDPGPAGPHRRCHRAGCAPLVPAARHPPPGAQTAARMNTCSSGWIRRCRCAILGHLRQRERTHDLCPLATADRPRPRPRAGRSRHPQRPHPEHGRRQHRAW
jgi:drug/metabolite transporter (DMT)-like permease